MFSAYSTTRSTATPLSWSAVYMRIPMSNAKLSSIKNVNAKPAPAAESTGDVSTSMDEMNNKTTLTRLYD